MSWILRNWHGIKNILRWFLTSFNLPPVKQTLISGYLKFNLLFERISPKVAELNLRGSLSKHFLDMTSLRHQNVQISGRWLCRTSSLCDCSHQNIQKFRFLLVYTLRWSDCLFHIIQLCKNIRFINSKIVNNFCPLNNDLSRVTQVKFRWWPWLWVTFRLSASLIVQSSCKIEKCYRWVNTIMSDRLNIHQMKSTELNHKPCSIWWNKCKSKLVLIALNIYLNRGV